MTAGEAKFIEWALLFLGILLVFTGWRTTRKRSTLADGREYEGKAAVRLGWLWIVIGILLIMAVVFDISFLKIFGRLFMETPS
jgi:heme/copper-type cytochrome/quinol oxidase subunit 2